MAAPGADNIGFGLETQRRGRSRPAVAALVKRQRVNLARALAIDPEVLLILRIWSEQRKTVLFITHQIDEAVYLADRVVVFSGRPSVVKATIAVHLPRPRPLSVKRQPAMPERVDQIWRLNEEEVRSGMVSGAGEGAQPASR